MKNVRIWVTVLFLVLVSSVAAVAVKGFFTLGCLGDKVDQQVLEVLHMVNEDFDDITSTTVLSFSEDCPHGSYPRNCGNIREYTIKVVVVGDIKKTQ